MRRNHTKPTSHTRFRLPTSVRRALVLASLVVLGLTLAWADAPLPRALRAWLATEKQSTSNADAAAPDAASPRGDAAAFPPPFEQRATRGDIGIAHVGAASGAASEGSNIAPDAELALPHRHGRRVDHLSRAHLLRDWDDLAGALTECRRAIHDAPDDVAALALAAELAGLTGRTDLAVRAHGQLGRLLPLDARPLVRQARLLVSLGRHAEAVSVGEEAVLRNPEYVEAYQVLGRAHLAQGELAKAMLRFEQAVHLHPEHGYALNNLGLTYLRAGEAQKAADVLVRAAELLPHVAYVHNNLGVAHERLGQVEEARAAYAAAMHLSPRYVQARVNADRMRRTAHAEMAGARTERGQLRPTQGEAPASR
ncbi:tetratricopeptide repeat protein [Myxococcus sp. NMCA1]|uniref:tetratricopeptide repeat protein n=1 Tax=Myxococcus sp. NMCA1 TaxID=2996785 RepID=UPI002285ABFB|nr:tetratricopeptide repeat protein [Myxococcus sp. NMCA1]WAM24250.1 tetratricopeptide repeat protein [Myxococcus sp. NMCA1]